MLFRNHFKNLIGFTTKRKIVVIESDDWGSIRTKSKDAYKNMLNSGLDVDNNSYTMNDTLESNQDLERLFDLLTQFKDINNRHPVFTPMYIMGNPNFDAIKSNNFTKYEFEHFLETCKQYPKHDKVSSLIKEGILSKVFMPELHGREHINAPRWMRLLQSKNEGILISFAYESIGASSYLGEPIPDYLCTYNPELSSDLVYVKESLKDAVNMFTNTFDYAPRHFIEPNDYGPMDIEEILHTLGIKFLLRAKVTRYSNYNNTYRRPHFHWVGKQNKWGQIYLTRNCTFEPHRPLGLKDIVGACLNEIDAAFQLGKPAVIISHRASYIGSINESNQVHGLIQLKQLLSEILKKWPDVEFMSSRELGEYILAKKNNC